MCSQKEKKIKYQYFHVVWVPICETEYFVHTALMTLSLQTSFSVFNMSNLCVSGGLKSCCWAFSACADLAHRWIFITLLLLLPLFTIILVL